MQTVILSEYNICLLDFCKMLKDYENNIINDLHVYGLLEKAKFTKDVKKILTHHIIYHICNTVISLKNNEKKVFYVYQDIELQIYNHIKKEKIDIFINDLLKKLNKLLPLNIIQGDEPFFQFCSKITSKNGNGYEALLKLLSQVEGVRIEDFTFSKIKNYAKRHELTFLTQEFFNSFSTKQHLLI